MTPLKLPMAEIIYIQHHSDAMSLILYRAASTLITVHIQSTNDAVTIPVYRPLFMAPILCDYANRYLRIITFI